MILKAVDIKKAYGDLQVLKGVNLEVKDSEVISITGASGAGKSTLLHILSTLDQPDNGKLLINDLSIDSLSAKNKAAFRNKNIGFVFQFHNLLPEFTAIENVAIPAFIAGGKRRNILKNAHDLLDMLGISNRASHKPAALSGGEQQRVAVARALINKPNIIFADEPSGNLDSENAHELHQLFFNLREKFQQTFVIVTHNNDLAAMADRKLVMKDGVFI